jgi:bla regulator protein blaR1
MLRAGTAESLAILILGVAAAAGNQMLGQTPTLSAPLATATKSHSASIAPYVNTRYGFRFFLPADWVGYSIIVREQSLNQLGDYSTIIIRHPRWTEEHPRQDIPIMVFTPRQWRMIQRGILNVSAAPFPPSELGRNKRYVFAIPPRYDYAFPDGYLEVEEIMRGNPLKAF